MVAFAPVALTASSTVLKTGPALVKSSALARRHSATTLSRSPRRPWRENVPSCPVIPAQSTASFYQLILPLLAPFRGGDSRSAASFIDCSTWNLMPDSARIFLPLRHSLPSSRSMIGSRNSASSVASTTADARMSTRRSAKDVDEDRLHVGIGQQNLKRILDRSCWRSAQSRKFAGLPPAVAYEMSIVAIANPAPFTMHAMLPSSLM